MLSLLFAAAAGCLGAFCFDIYRTLSGIMRLKKLGRAIGDILFWVSMAGLVFLFFLLGNGGEVRGFMLLGLVAGAGVYYRVLGNRPPRAIARGFDWVRTVFVFSARVLAIMWGILTAPFKLAFFLVSEPIRFCVLLLKKTPGLGGKIVSRLLPVPVTDGLGRIFFRIKRWKLRMGPRRK